MPRTETRDDVIEEAAEFSLTDNGAYYYNEDLAYRFGLSADELEQMLELASELRDRRRGW